MKSRMEFTIIELLVVVAIMAVLASLLLPALASARQSASSIYCSGNMRQLGIGVSSYADSSDGFCLAACAWNPLSSAKDLFWLVNGLFLESFGRGGGNETWATLGSKPLGVYHCRAAQDEAQFNAIGSKAVNYAMNGSGFSESLRIGVYKKPAQLLCFVDSDWVDAGSQLVKAGAAAENRLRMSNRHLAGLNMAFLDGHVSYFKKQACYDLAGNWNDHNSPFWGENGNQNGYGNPY